MANRVTVKILDENGLEARSIFHIQDGVTDVDWADMMDALQDCTHGELVTSLMAEEWEYTGSAATSGPYDAEDRAVLEFRDEDDRPYLISVSSPKADMFEADGKTVKKDKDIVLELIAQVVALCATAAGKLIVEFVKGWRSRRKGA